MLDYDNNAFYYFSITLLSIYLLPGCWYALSETFQAFFSTGGDSTKARTETEKVKTQKLKKELSGLARLKKTPFLINLAILCVTIPLFLYLLRLVGSDGEVNSFDPYHILGVSTEATANEIKKAYRRLSLKYHPDKNPGNKIAEEMFVKLTKAYEALTDEVSKENYRRFGNPDGKQSLEVSIGLPKLVLEHPKIVLILYLIGMVVVIPVAVGLWYSNSKQFGEKNIMYATYKAFYQNVDQNTRFVHLPEILAASAEFRACNGTIAKTGEAEALGKLYSTLKEEKMFDSNREQALRFPEHPAILRGNLLLHSHLLRHGQTLPQTLRDDLDVMLAKAPELIDGIIEIAYNRKWLETTFNTIRFSQCLVQGLWANQHFLCQLPHFADKETKEMAKALRTPIKTMTDYLRLPDAEKKGLSTLTEVQKKEVLETCQLLPKIKIETKLVVEEDDEDMPLNAGSEAIATTEPSGYEIYEEDLVTLKITITRENVLEGKEAAPVLAPYFPRSIKEGWWVILTDKAPARANADTKRKGPEPNILGVEKVTNQARVVVHELRFMAPPKAGQYVMDLHVLSDCYVGFDEVIEIIFDVKPKADLPVYAPHPDDVALDNEPTLFEQVLAANVDEDSSDDEDENESATGKGKVKAIAGSSSVIEELGSDEE